MIDWIKKNKSSIIRIMFIIPILLVAAISISHVISWYDLANPISWAIYLSIAVEIAAMTALSAASVKVKGFSVWLVFCIVTIIQFIGNIFFSYNEIDINNQNFKNWVELVSPIFDVMGLDSSDLLTHKRWLALLTGGLLPLISLTCLHFFIKYGGADDEIIKDVPDSFNDRINENSSEKVKKEMNVKNVVDSNYEKSVENISELISESDLPQEDTNLSLTENNGIIEDSSNLEEEQKKNNSTEFIGGGSTDQGTTNNPKIQLGSPRSGENIIYKQNALRQ